MRILMIGNRGSGGIQNYSVTVSHCLKKLAPCLHLGEDEPFVGKSGYDLREGLQNRRVVKTLSRSMLKGMGDMNGNAVKGLILDKNVIR